MHNFKLHFDVQIVTYLLGHFSQQADIENYTIFCYESVTPVMYKVVGDRKIKCFIIASIYDEGVSTLKFPEIKHSLTFARKFRDYCKSAKIEFQQFVIVTNKKVLLEFQSTPDLTLSKSVGVLSTHNFNVYDIRDHYVFHYIVSNFEKDVALTCFESTVFEQALKNLTQSNNKIINLILDNLVGKDLNALHRVDESFTVKSRKKIIKANICNNIKMNIFLQLFLADGAHVLDKKYFLKEEDGLIFQRDQWIEENITKKFLTRDVTDLPRLDLSDVRILSFVSNDVTYAAKKFLRVKYRTDDVSASTLLALCNYDITEKMVKFRGIKISKESFEKRILKNLVKNLQRVKINPTSIPVKSNNGPSTSNKI